MTKRGTSGSHIETVEIKGEKFELELPSELQIKPKFTIKVSKNCTMLVYDDKQEKTIYIDGQQQTVKVECFAYTVVNAEGHVVKKAADPYRYRNDGELIGVADDLLDLMWAVKAAARRLVVKKKTTKVVEEDEDEY